MRITFDAIHVDVVPPGTNAHILAALELRLELRSLLLTHDPTELLELVAEEFNALPAEARHGRRADLRILSREYQIGAFD